MFEEYEPYEDDLENWETEQVYRDLADEAEEDAEGYLIIGEDDEFYE